MKTYHVIRNMAIDKDHAIEISETFLSKERAGQAAEHLTKYEEKDFKVEEVEEDLIVDDGIAFRSYVTLNYSNGVEVQVGLNDSREYVGEYDMRWLLNYERIAFERHNELHELKGDTKHMVHDIILKGFDEIVPGVWRAQYELIGSIINQRSARGNLFIFDDKKKQLKPLSDLFEQMGNLSIYW